MSTPDPRHVAMFTCHCSVAVQAAHEWEGRPVPELQEAAMKVLHTLFGDKATQPVASTASAWKTEPHILGMCCLSTT